MTRGVSAKLDRVVNDAPSSRQTNNTKDHDLGRFLIIWRKPYGRTNGPTNRRKDKPAHRDAETHLKMSQFWPRDFWEGVGAAGHFGCATTPFISTASVTFYLHLHPPIKRLPTSNANNCTSTIHIHIIIYKARHTHTHTSKVSDYNLAPGIPFAYNRKNDETFEVRSHRRQSFDSSGFPQIEDAEVVVVVSVASFSNRRRRISLASAAAGSPSPPVAVNAASETASPFSVS